MNVLLGHLQGLPVLSLQTGETVATLGTAFTRITNLEIVAFECFAGSQRFILAVSDIRQIAADCLLVNSEDELSEPEDLVRLEDILRSHYQPLGKSVATESGHALGRVNDASLNLDTSLVQQLFVRPPRLKFWQKTTLTIDRSQILDLTPTRITVRDAMVKTPIMPAKTVPDTST